MKIGIVSLWCNRGQGIVARQIRSIFDEAGHETFVLARPTNPEGPIGGFVDTREEWRMDRVRAASAFLVPRKELLDWTKENGIETVFFDMFRQYEDVRSLRDRGIRTVGRFVWERFGPDEAPAAQAAFDTIYSLTRAEKEVYGTMGIESPYARWGIHPSLLQVSPPKRSDGIYFIFHGGLQGKRKPLAATVKCFKEVRNPNARLIIKSQGIRDSSEAFQITDDPRIEHVVEDLDERSYYDHYASCHVSLAPSRWEGLGVHLFESIAFGMPVVTNDIPPINEVIEHDKSGLLLKSHLRGTRKNGLKVFDFDEADFVRQIEDIAQPERLAELTRSTSQQAERFPWSNTASDFLALAEGSLGN
jgi:1,2-diacylglycerol 3-alpha-glucosyltransferase